MRALRRGQTPSDAHGQHELHAAALQFDRVNPPVRINAPNSVTKRIAQAPHVVQAAVEVTDSGN